MAIDPPHQIFAFTNKVPEGDRVDAQFADHAHAIVTTQDAVNDIRRTDGALKNEIVTADSLHPGLVEQLTFDFAQGIAAQVTQVSVDAAIAAAATIQAQDAALQAQVAAADAFGHSQIIIGGASSALAQIDQAMIAAQGVFDLSTQKYNTIINAASDSVGATALAEDWADVSFHWAEYMPGTIPPNILATMGITGDHWSSRWWANYTDQRIAEWTAIFDTSLINLEQFNDLYLGAHAIPPVTDNDGNALLEGAMYWNEIEDVMYVWTGSSWAPIAGVSGGGGTVTGAENLGSGAGVFAQANLGLLQFKSLKFDPALFGVTQAASEIQVTLTAVPWSAITGEPTTIAGYGITDAYTKTQADAAVAGKVSRTGDTMTGMLTIGDAGAGVNGALLFNHGAGGTNTIQAKSNGAFRWQMYLGGTPAESGGDTGSWFHLTAYKDNGTPTNVLNGNRADGRLTVAGDPTDLLGIATKQYVDTAAGAAAGLKVAKAGDTMTGALNITAGGLKLGTGTPLSPSPITIAGASGFQAIALLRSDGPAEGTIGVDLSGVILGAITNHPVQIRTNNTARINITAAGSVDVTGPLTFNGGNAVAPLNSPVFIGTPTAPTPASLDNDTSIATTAFVQSEIAVKRPLTQYAEFTSVYGASVLIPLDASVPQITEGVELLTVTVTTAAGDKVHIDVDANVACNPAGHGIIAIFVDAVADAIYAKNCYTPTDVPVPLNMSFVHVPGAGTHTYRLRWGPGAAGYTAYLNCNSSATLLFGAATRMTFKARVEKV